MGEVSEIDVAMMRRAMGLAMRGRGSVEPNPMVGCVIVKEGRVIGGGWHQKYGEAHAEPNAIASCAESSEGATAYVTLEPCCHLNKKTPPCVPMVIGAGIKRVVVGCLDPNVEVNGKGIAQLKEAGVEVVGPVLEGECKQLIAPFLARVKLGRPYVTLKWAESADGKVAGAGGKRMRISNARSSRVVHELRARSEAIVVGIGTVLADDPLLTARDVALGRSGQPVRIVLDSGLRMPMQSQLVRTADEGAVWVYFSPGGHAGRIRELVGAGVEVKTLGAGEGGLDLRGMVGDVGASGSGVTHMLVEAGPTLARGFFAQNAADRVWVIRSQMEVGDKSAPAAAVVPEGFVKVGEVGLGGDVLEEWLNEGSEVFFAAVESADFVRVTDSVMGR